MTNVVDLASRRKAPHMVGPVRCASCKAEWTAVAPVGTCTLECPECSAFQGTWRNAVRTGDETLNCERCGNDTYAVGRTEGIVSIYCVYCGSEAEPYG